MIADQAEVEDAKLDVAGGATGVTSIPDASPRRTSASLCAGGSWLEVEREAAFGPQIETRRDGQLVGHARSHLWKAENAARAWQAHVELLDEDMTRLETTSRRYTSSLTHVRLHEAVDPGRLMRAQRFGRRANRRRRPLPFEAVQLERRE